MTRSTEPSGRRSPRTRLWVLAILGLGAFLAAWSLTRPGDPFGPGTRTFEEAGVRFSYPTGWAVYDNLPRSTGFGSTVAILGNQPWGLCLPGDINCHYRLRLEPSQISVDLGVGSLFRKNICELGADRSDLAGRGPDDPAAVGHLMRVAGRPTLATDYVVNQKDYYLSDAWREWTIAAPGGTSSVYRISAKYRGPGAQEFSDQLDALIASITFPGPLQQGGNVPKDCGPPFP